ncbi:MAG TPA: ABC transporter permease [Thermoanaerobaculia bacterium]|nr:ABC transporter permease [Thermoanaerobaculia bacterium]
MTPSRPRPPVWARLVLWLAAPRARRPDVLGDLEEVHAARRARDGALRAWLASSADALLCAAALGAQRIREQAHGALAAGRHGTGGLTTLGDLRIGLRLLARQPLMTLTSTLALTVGFCLAIVGFVLLDGAFYSRLPFDDAGRWVRLEARLAPRLEAASLEPARFDLLRMRAASFRHLGARRGGRFNLEHRSGAVESVTGTALTPETFGALPYAPVAGRLLAPADAEPGAEPVVLIRASLRDRLPLLTPSAIGETLVVGGAEHTIVGVLPNTAQFPNGGELWLPLRLPAGGAAAMERAAVQVFGVLADGASRDRATTELRVLSARFELEHQDADRLELQLAGYTELPAGPAIRALFFFTVAILVCVLLVVAANVANLVLARTAARVGELAVRSALGAGRTRLVAQLTAETALLGLGSAALGLGAARWSLRSLEQLIDERPFWVTFTVAPRTMAFVAALTLLAAAVIGILPALAATRRDPVAALRSARGGRGGFAFGRAGGVLIAAQLGISVALLTGALVMGRGFASYLDPAYQVPRAELLTGWVHLGADERRAASARAVARAARAAPGVLGAGAASYLPSQDPPLVRVEVEGSPPPAGGGPEAPIVHATDGFLETLGARALSGRLLRATDLGRGAPAVAVVNRPFADRFLDGAEAVGRRVRLLESDADGESQWGPWREIVGVVAELGLSTADPAHAGGLYLPLDDRRGFHLAVRTDRRPVETAPALRRALLDLDAELTVASLRPLSEVEREQRSAMLALGAGLAALGAVALLLSLVSLYALVTFALARRTRELGVRLALGAGARRIAWSVVRPVATHFLAGSALGASLALLLLRARGIFVFRLPPAGIETVGGVVLVLGAACALACVGPVRRALSLHPVDALREE